MTTKLASFATALCISSFLFGTSVEELSLEEKVGQLLIAHFHGEEVTQEAEILISDVHVGGIIYYTWANGLSSPRQICLLSHGLQATAAKTAHRIPLLIAADQEGGLVARLTNGFTIFPGNRAIAMTLKPSFAKSCAQAMGEEALKVGVNWILAPVADVNRARNPVIGIRSFGEEGKAVAQLVQQALTGYREVKVLSCLKHFPGHGDVETDSHFDLPIITKSRKDLDIQDLVPFFAAKDSADAIMTGHLFVPAIDPVNCATLSPKIIKLLRDDMGFDGVVVTDSLVMEGLLKQCSSIDETAIRALEAGHDLLMLGGKTLLNGQASPLELTVDDVRRIHSNIIQAVKNGRLPVDRIDQAVSRVLALKNRMSWQVNPNVVGESVSSMNHQTLSAEVAKRALRTKGEKPQGFDIRDCCAFAPDSIKQSVSETLFGSLFKDSCYYYPLNPPAETQQKMLKLAQNSKTILFFTYNAWKNKEQEKVLQTLISLGKRVIIIVTRDPLDDELFPNAQHIITTYSPTTPSLQAAANMLFQE